MSRGFVKEDDGYEPPGRFGLPDRSDPSYDAASALALLEAARHGDTHSAEVATGYRFGDPHLHRHVEKLMKKEEARPEMEQDARFLRIARRFLEQG